MIFMLAFVILEVYIFISFILIWYNIILCILYIVIGVSAGHYTAYAKNPRTDTWYYYNDEITSRQKPQEEDFSNAYILFYSRQGTNLKSCNI